jgi:hypothetical protein
VKTVSRAGPFRARSVASPVLWTWLTCLASLSFLWQAGHLALSPLAFGAVCALLALPVAWSEVRHRSLSTFLDECWRSRARTSILLAIVFAALARFYWMPGFRLYTLGDGAPHFVNTWTVFRAFQEGEIPFWNNYWGCGSPFLQFYPPLFFYAAAGLLFLREDLLFAIRILLFLLHLLSGFTLYRLARALGSPRSGGAVAATAYVLAPWHVFQLFHFNRFPVAPVYVFLPVLFLSCEKARQRPLQACLLGAGALAVIALSHQGYAIFSLALFLLYGLFRAAPAGPHGSWISLRAALRHCLSVSVLGLALSSFLWVPHMLEAALLPFLPSLTPMQGVKGFVMDNPYVATLLLWSRKPIGHSGYIGLSLLALGLSGAAFRVHSRGTGWPSLLACLAASFFLVLGHTNVLYSWIPFVYSQFYAGRYLIFLVFFLSIAVAFSFRPSQGQNDLPQAAGSRLQAGLAFVRSRAPLVCLGVILVDFLPIATFVQEAPRYATEDQGRVYASIRERRIASRLLAARAVDLPQDFASRNHGSLVLPFEAGVPTPEAGQFGTLGSYGYIYKILKSARETLTAYGTMPEEVRQALCLLNVRYVFSDALTEGAAKALGGENFGGPLWLLTLSESQPIVATNRLEPARDRWPLPRNAVDLVLDRWDPPDPIGEILSTMEFDPARMRAKRIWIREEGAPLEVSPQLPDSVQVEEQELGLSWLRLRVSASSDCFLQLSQSFYPYQSVLLDGAPCPKVYRSVMDFIVIPFPAGTHTVEVRAFLSPIRKATLALSGFVLAGMVFAAVVGRRGR